MMQIAVTGATGFIGTHLINRLINDGHTVRALVRDTGKAPVDWKDVTVIQGEINDQNSLVTLCEQTELLIHLASILGPSGTPESIFRKINVDGTRFALEAALAAKVGFFIHCSSCGIHGSVQGAPVDETTPPQPLDAYERSKAEAEKLVLNYINSGNNACIIRPAWVYGPGDRRTLKLIKSIARKRFLFAGSAQNRQHPVFIDDLIDGIALCIGQLQKVQGKTYILAGNEIVTIEQLCNTIAQVAGVTIPRFRIPLGITLPIARVLEKCFYFFNKEAPINISKVDFFIKHRAFRNDKARNELGFAPKVSLYEGMQQAIAFYRKAGWL